MKIFHEILDIYMYDFLMVSKRKKMKKTTKFMNFLRSSKDSQRFEMRDQYFDELFARREIDKFAESQKKALEINARVCQLKGLKFDLEKLEFMSKDEVASLSEADQEIYMKVVEAIVFLEKIFHNKTVETPLIQNSFLRRVMIFESYLSQKEIIELIELANSAHQEEVFGLKLYTKLMGLKQDKKIFGMHICDRIYSSCVMQSGVISS